MDEEILEAIIKLSKYFLGSKSQIVCFANEHRRNQILLDASEKTGSTVRKWSQKMAAASKVRKQRLRRLRQT